MFGQNNNDQVQPADPSAGNPMLQNSMPPAGFNPSGQPQQPVPAAPNDTMDTPSPEDVFAPEQAQTPEADQSGAPAIMATDNYGAGAPDLNQPSLMNDPLAAPAQDAPAATDSSMIMDTNPTDFYSPSTPVDTPASPAVELPQTPSQPANADQLLAMKQTALQELQPLVGHLDQSPEEKFRTLMMMIQASDDHTKLQDAFDLAKQITDEKIRAQALLDVINEINYFTQQQQQ